MKKTVLLLGISSMWLYACGNDSTEEPENNEVKESSTEETESTSSEEIAVQAPVGTTSEELNRTLNEQVITSDDDVYGFMDKVNSEFFSTDTIETTIAVGLNIVNVNIEKAYKLSYTEFVYHLQYGNSDYTEIWSAYIQTLIEASKILSDNLGTYTVKVNSPMGTGHFFTVTDGEIEIDTLGISPSESTNIDDLYYEANRSLDFPEFDDIAEANQHLLNQLDSDQYFLFFIEDYTSAFLQPLGETRDYLVNLNESLKYSDDRYEEWLEYELDFFRYSMFINDNIDSMTHLFIAIDMINEDDTFNMDSLSNEDRLLARYNYGKIIYSPLSKEKVVK